MKWKNRLIIILFIVLSIGLIVKFTNGKEINIEEVLEGEAYSYLSEESKAVLTDYYNETGVVVKTSKNKSSGEPYYNDKYDKYLTSEFKEEYDAIPEMFIVDYVPDPNYTATEMPSSFNLNNVDGKNFTYPNRNQSSSGLCWAFSTYGQSESLLLQVNNKSYSSGDVVFSERQLDYATAINGVKGMTSFYPRGNRNLYEDGGNYTYASRVLMNGHGYYDESFLSDFYETSRKEGNEVYNLNDSLYELNSSVSFPSGDDLDAASKKELINKIKEYVSHYGGAYVGTGDPSGYCSIAVNGKRFIYEDGNCDSAGHAMQIVGWDDNVSYSFCPNLSDGQGHTYISATLGCTSSEKVTGKGVWILRNSWGSSYSTVYLAYDSKLYDVNLSTNIGKKDWDNYYSNSINYDGHYIYRQFDYEKKTNGQEKLTKIKIDAPAQNNPYKITIKNGSNTKTYTITSDLPGIYTYEIPDTFILNKGGITVTTNAYLDTVNLYTVNVDDTKDIITEDVVYEADLDNSSTYDFRIKSILHGFDDDTEFDYKILDYSGNEITSDYTYTYNSSFSNSLNTLLQIDDNLRKGVYTVQVIYNGNVYSTSTLTLNSEKINVEGSGTEADPYLIGTPEQLNLLRNDKYAYFRLTNDIDLTYDTQNPNGMYYNDGKGWEPITYGQYYWNGFTGGLDGCGYTIKGLYINRPDTDYVGLFASIYNNNYSTLTFKDITFKDSKITGRSYVGSLAGAINEATYERRLTLNNVFVESGNITGNSYVGGVTGRLVGGSKLRIYDETIHDFIDQTRFDVNSLYNSAYVKGITHVGGISGSIENCAYESSCPLDISALVNQGTIEARSDDVGPIFGSVDLVESNIMEFNDLINTGKLIGNNTYSVYGTFSGGAVADLTINNAYSTRGTVNKYMSSNSKVSVLGIDELVDKTGYGDYTDYLKFKFITVNEKKRIPSLAYFFMNYIDLDTKDIKLNLNSEFNLETLIKNNDVNYVMKDFDYVIDKPDLISIDNNIITSNNKTGMTRVKVISNYDGSSYDIDVFVTSNVHTITYHSGFDDSISTSTNNIISDSMFTRVGYTFSHWSLNNSDEVYHKNDQISLIKDVDLYAVWNPIEYTINYYDNYSDNDPVVQKVLYDEEKRILKNTFTNKGYGFVSWNTKSDGSGVTYHSGDKIINLLSTPGSINLYAIWEVNYVIEVDDYILGDDNYIDGIEDNTDINNFLSHVLINNKYSYQLDVNTNNGLIYTGGKLKIYSDDDLYREYVLVIRGDINGDGIINSGDMFKLRQHLLTVNTLENVYFVAGDTNKDNIINSGDMFRVRQHLLGVKRIGE